MGEMLAELGEEDACREHHLRFFMDFARAGFNGMMGKLDHSVSIDRLATDNDNLVSALSWAICQRDAPGALRLAGYLCRFWSWRGLWHDGQTWSDAALSMSPPGEFPAERGILLWGSGIQSAITGDTQTGIMRIVEGQQLLENAGDLENATRALVFAGMFMSTSGDTERGTRCLDRALTLARKHGDSWAQATALTALAHTAMTNEDYALARLYAEESLVQTRSTGVLSSVAHVTNLLGDISRLEGAYQEAYERYEKALALTAESGATAFVPSFRHNLAWASHDLGNDSRALDLFPSSIREFQQMGDERGVAECLIGLGCAISRPEVAARLFAAGFSLLEKNEMTLSRPNQGDFDRSVAWTREALGEEAWQASWADGGKLTPDQALALVTADMAAP
jgi:tetratricopeptide (TPR) repeat protein